MGVLSQFLTGLGVPSSNPGTRPGQRGAECNDWLAEVGYDGRVHEAKLKGKCGKTPTVASKDTLRRLYDFFQ